MVRKKTHEEFVTEVKALVGDEYTVIGRYTGNKDDILIRHNNESCGFFEKPVKPNHFLRGRRCRVCSQRAKAEKLIDLVRIPYWHFDDIEDILTNKLGGKLNYV